jgi:hypothetical protein
MSRCLIVVPHRGDELAYFGALLPHLDDWETASVFTGTRAGTTLSLTDWDAALRELGGRAADLCLPPIDPSLYDLNWLLPELITRLEPYDAIYAPCPASEGPAGISTAVIAAALADTEREIWLAGGTGLPDQVYKLDPAGLARASTHMDRNYRALAEAEARIQTPLASIVSLRRARARDCLQFALHFGPQVTNFGGWYTVLAARFDDPWGLTDSPHECRRHAMELALLENDPGNIVEIGACTGIQTRHLIDRFGADALTCIEPHAGFAATLRTLGVRVLEAPAHRVEEAFDTVVMSCCLYDMKTWPSRLIETSRRHVLTSHGPGYTRDTVMPTMKAAGWSVQFSNTLPPATETYMGLPITREGALMQLWAKG